MFRSDLKKDFFPWTPCQGLDLRIGGGLGRILWSVLELSQALAALLPPCRAHSSVADFSAEHYQTADFARLFERNTLETLFSKVSTPYGKVSCAIELCSAGDRPEPCLQLPPVAHGCCSGALCLPRGFSCTCSAFSATVCWFCG